MPNNKERFYNPETKSDFLTGFRLPEDTTWEEFEEFRIKWNIVAKLNTQRCCGCGSVNCGWNTNQRCFHAIFPDKVYVEVFADPKVVNAPEILVLKQHVSRLHTSKSEMSQPFDPNAFYQTIIDNNIFRSLNYKPKQREPVFTLLGTSIATNGNTATAYIKDRQSERFHIVKVGDPLGESTVQEITSKRVTLTTKKGSRTNLMLGGNIFLNMKHTQSRRSYEQIPQTQSHTENRTTAKSKKGTATEIDPRRLHEEGIQRLKKRANELRSERIRMQERLRYLEQH